MRVHAGVAGEGEQPGQQRCSRPEAVPCLVNTKPEFLQQLLGIGLRPARSQKVTHQEGGYAFDQLLKGLFVSLLIAGHEFL